MRAPRRGLQAVTLRRYAGTFAANTGKVTETYTDYAVQAVVTDYEDALVDGTTVLRGDKRLVLAAAGLSITPTAATTVAGAPQRDAALVAGEWLNVVSVRQYAPRGRTELYEVQVRK